MIAGRDNLMTTADKIRHNLRTITVLSAQLDPQRRRQVVSACEATSTLVSVMENLLSNLQEGDRSWLVDELETKLEQALAKQQELIAELETLKSRPRRGRKKTDEESDGEEE